MEDLLGKAMLRLIEGGSPDLEATIPERHCQSTVNTVRLDLRNLLVTPLVSVLVPDRHARGMRH
jgi:hypothetical protein